MMRILLFGDVMLGENLFHTGRGIRTRFKNNYESIISEHIKTQLIEKSDMLFVNLECSLAENEFIQNGAIENFIYTAEKDSLKFLPNSIPKIFNIANNHFSQHGISSVHLSKSIINEQKINLVGDSNDPLIIIDKQKLLKFWGFSLVEDTQNCGGYNLVDERYVKTFFEKMQKTENELWCVSLHWGEEYMPRPTITQINFAHYLIDLGVDLIIGHHPHIIQPIEYYNNKLIIYSLGNFIFDQNFSIETCSGLVVNINTDELDKSEFYVSKQSNYIVTDVHSISKEKAIEGYHNLDTFDKNYIASKYNKLMKLEYIKNIFLTNHRVLFFLIKKYLKKIFN